MNLNVKSLSHHEVLIAFSALTTQAFLQVHYDKVDDKNHKSLNHLVHALSEAGYPEFLDILEAQKPYAVFATPLDSLKAYHFINEHSAAVSVSLYYRGTINEEAEAKIHREFDVKEHLSVLLDHKV